MTWRGLAVVMLLALPAVAAAQGNQAQFQSRFDSALAVFNSPRQPEAIPQFSQLIDDLRTLRNRSNELTTLLARALLYRAQARENVGQTADADADLRLIREVAPSFRLTDPGLSAALVNRFNAMTPQQQTPAPRDQTRVAGTRTSRGPTYVSGGYQYIHFTDCGDCDLTKGWYLDVSGSLIPSISWAGEVSGGTGDFTFMFFGAGARFHPTTASTRVLPYGQVLFGGIRESVEGFSQSKGAVHLSGGVDYLINTKVGVRGGLAYMRALGESGGFGVIRVIVGVTAIIR